MFESTTPNRGAPMKRGPTVPRAGRRGPFSLKSKFFGRFWPHRSGPDGSGQAVGLIWSLFRAKRMILEPFRTKFDVFGADPNFGQPGLDLGRSWPTLDDLGPTLDDLV